MRSPAATLFPYTTLFRSRHLPHSIERRPSMIALSPRKKPGRETTRRRIAAWKPNLELLEDRTLPSGVVDSFEGSALDPFRSEEHTSELQSRRDLVCRLLL